jgi:hypothetical protein
VDNELPLTNKFFGSIWKKLGSMTSAGTGFLSKSCNTCVKGLYVLCILGYNDFDFSKENNSPGPSMNAKLNSKTHL